MSEKLTTLLGYAVSPDIVKITEYPRLFAAVLVGLWLLGTVAGFWWFEFKDLRAFGNSSTTRFFDGVSLQRSVQAFVPDHGGQPRPVVVHFWDPQCPCSRFSNSHVRQLVTSYTPKGFRFVVVTPTGSVEKQVALARQAREVFGEVEVVFTQVGQLEVDIPSSPAAVILDPQRRLAYFGPYSSGAVCSAGPGSFVEAILDDVASGHNPAKVNTLAYGCFCGWGKDT